MGLYDRDYIRVSEPRAVSRGRGGWPDVRLWSVTTWIIVICAAVYVADNYALPPRDVPTGRLKDPTGRFSEQDLLAIPAPMWTYGPKRIVETAHLPDGREVPVAYWRAMFDKSTGQPIGGLAQVYPMRFLESYLHFSTRLAFIWPHLEWWRFIGFQFLHANEYHLVFNMLGLFFFGGMVEQYLGSKRYLAFYLLCGIFGALMYLLLNLLGIVAGMYLPAGIKIPGLLFSSLSTPLVGASAGIFGVIMAGAFLAPRAVVLLFFVLPMQLRTMAYALLAVALATVLFGGKNAGGEAGHIGGALAGFYFIRHPHHLHGFFDFLGHIDPTSHHYRHRDASRRAVPAASPERDAEVDRILDKIRAQGIHSLTDQEKHILGDASRRGT